MRDDAPFNPDWVSPPGATIAALLAKRGVTPQEFAVRVQLPTQEVEALMHGRVVLTIELIRRLTTVLGATVDFWREREAQYRRGLERLREQCSRPESLDWLREVPVKELVKRGWVEPAADPTETVVACLRFFGVSSVQSWSREYKEPLQAAAFRTSKAFASDPGVVAAWFRQGEIEASRIRCGPWDRDRFLGVLPGIRALTRVEDPVEFIPELTRRCAECGVAVAVVRAPKGCRASGACRFLSPTRPLLLLSGRHLSDDHLWFTFFHEAGHLVLHSKDYISVDVIGDEDATAKEEQEANDFAADMLVPPDRRDEMLKLPLNKIAVMRFARRIGVSRGVVVGQLQHHGVIGRNQLNDLKHRYRWGTD
jgi:plasmid maintenance system antidote protein VapI